MFSKHPRPQAGDLVGKYRIDRSLGAGRMGCVFAAVDVDTGARVALKWLYPELSRAGDAASAFRADTVAVGRLQHPNLTTIFEVGEHQGAPYVAMELLAGRTLRERIEEGPLSVPEAVQILLPVMRGVAAAHAVGVLHRDLRPRNIFLCEVQGASKPVPKLLDFGVAKLRDAVPLSTAHSLMMGSYPYMALEQLQGRTDLDVRVDVYALGAVLYHMLTGKLPHEARNPMDLALQMLKCEPRPLSAYARGTPLALDAVVEKALSREREQRYATVFDFARALEPYAKASYRPPPEPAPRRPSVPVVTLPPKSSEAVSEGRRSSLDALLKHRYAWLGAAALLLLGLAAWRVLTPAPHAARPPSLPAASPPRAAEVERSAAPLSPAPAPADPGADDWAAPLIVVGDDSAPEPAEAPQAPQAPQLGEPPVRHGAHFLPVRAAMGSQQSASSAKPARAADAGSAPGRRVSTPAGASEARPTRRYRTPSEVLDPWEFERKGVPQGTRR